jgi:salicylate hydroxylase
MVKTPDLPSLMFITDLFWSIGIKSRVRRAVIPGREVEIRPDPNCAYRTLIPGALMTKDPLLKPLIKNPTATCWIGHEGHVMAYPIRNGSLYNFVMCHPGSVAVGKPNEPASLDDMRERYRDWDPIITRLIDLVPQCLKWQNAELEKLDDWLSQSGRVVLVGDASHGMVPYMAQGAAMAIEDGIALAECLARASTPRDIPDLMQHFCKLRRERCYIILDGARNNGRIWHLPDGPEQRSRDEGMRNGPQSSATSEIGSENPNRWSDPKFQPWMFGFDAHTDVSLHLRGGPTMLTSL